MSGILPNKELLRPDEVADYLRIKVKAVYDYIDDGTLDAIRIKGKRILRIKRESVISILMPVEK
jgi:excisionase family DNA binding protein